MFQKNAFIWLAPQRHKLKRRQIVFIKSHGIAVVYFHPITFYTYLYPSSTDNLPKHWQRTIPQEPLSQRHWKIYLKPEESSRGEDDTNQQNRNRRRRRRRKQRRNRKRYKFLSLTVSFTPKPGRTSENRRAWGWVATSRPAPRRCLARPALECELVWARRANNHRR